MKCVSPIRDSRPCEAGSHSNTGMANSKYLHAPRNFLCVPIMARCYSGQPWPYARKVARRWWSVHVRIPRLGGGEHIRLDRSCSSEICACVIFSSVTLWGCCVADVAIEMPADATRWRYGRFTRFQLKLAQTCAVSRRVMSHFNPQRRQANCIGHLGCACRASEA